MVRSFAYQQREKVFLEKIPFSMVHEQICKACLRTSDVDFLDKNLVSTTKGVVTLPGSYVYAYFTVNTMAILYLSVKK